MNSLTSSPQATPVHPRSEHEAARPGLDEPGRARLRLQLENRFRHSLRSGQLCPLLHLVIRYKLESGV